MTRISTMVAIKKEMSTELMTANQLHASTRIDKRTIRSTLNDMLSLGLVDRIGLPRSMWESSHHSEWGWKLRSCLCNSHENCINPSEVKECIR